MSWVTLLTVASRAAQELEPLKPAPASSIITKSTAAQLTAKVASEVQKSKRARLQLKRSTGVKSAPGPKYPCCFEGCTWTFTRPSHLQKHLYIHTGERPFKCNTCSKSFSTNWTLTKHTRIHTGEKPYSCSFCSLTFSQRGSWRRHNTVHHPDFIENLDGTPAESDKRHAVQNTAKMSSPLKSRKPTKTLYNPPTIAAIAKIAAAETTQRSFGSDTAEEKSPSHDGNAMVSDGNESQKYSESDEEIVACSPQ